VLLYCLHLNLKKRAQSQLPPLVSYALPFIGSAFSFGKDPILFLRKAYQKAIRTFLRLLYLELYIFSQ
jgi:hypothetical protein